MCDCSIDALVMQRVPISHAAFALGRARGAYPESIEFLRRSASPCIRSFFAASCLAERARLRFQRRVRGGRYLGTNDCRQQ